MKVEPASALTRVRAYGREVVTLQAMMLMSGTTVYLGHCRHPVGTPIR